MLSFSTIQSVIAGLFFDDSLVYAGLAMYAVVLAVILVISKSPFKTLLLALPVTVLFSGIGILSGDLMVIMVIICVLGLAVTASKVGLGR